MSMIHKFLFAAYTVIAKWGMVYVEECDVVLLWAVI